MGEAWRKIETAPKDWSNILLYQEDSGENDDVFEGFFAPGEYAGDNEWHRSVGDIANPTHWMPLPPPPTRDAE